MRYELTDHELAAIKPMLQNKPRGVPRVNDRRALNGIFWSCDLERRGAIFRAASVHTLLAGNRFVCWRQSGVWSRIIDALAAAHDTAVQMIDTRLCGFISTPRPSLSTRSSPWVGRDACRLRGRFTLMIIGVGALGTLG